jgi:hypothetical protein
MCTPFIGAYVVLYGPVMLKHRNVSREQLGVWRNWQQFAKSAIEPVKEQMGGFCRRL